MNQGQIFFMKPKSIFRDLNLPIKHHITPQGSPLGRNWDWSKMGLFTLLTFSNRSGTFHDFGLSGPEKRQKLESFEEGCGWTKVKKFFIKPKNMFRDLNLPIKHHITPQASPLGQNWDWSKIKFSIRRRGINPSKGTPPYLAQPKLFEKEWLI